MKCLRNEVCLRHNEVTLRANGLTFKVCCYKINLGDIMKEDKLGDLSMELSVDVLSLCKKLDRLCSTIRVLLIKSINTAKANQK